MVLLKITPRIRHEIALFLSSSQVSHDVTSNERRLLETCLDSGYIDHKQLVQVVSENTNDGDREKTSISSILKGTEFVWPEKPKAEKSETYLKTMEEARRIVEEKEYSEMTKRVDTYSPSHQNKNHWDAQELKIITKQMIALTNAMFSILAVCGGTFYVSGNVISDDGMRVLLSLAVALIVMVAEGWFFTRYALVLDHPTQLSYNPKRSSSKSISKNGVSFNKKSIPSQ